MLSQIVIPSGLNRLCGVINKQVQSFDENRTIILFLHGFGSTKDEFGYLFARLAKNIPNMDSLLFDYYGCGDSPGNLEEVTYTSMESNARNVITYIKENMFYKKLIVVARGISVPIAFQLSKEYEIDKIICFSGIDKYNFPLLDNKLIEEWKQNKKIEVKKLLYNIHNQVNLPIMEWLENLGASKGYIIGDFISFDFIEEIANIKFPNMNATPSNLLWFTRNKNQMKPKIDATWQVFNYQYYELSDFIDPVDQDEMITKINSWIEI